MDYFLKLLKTELAKYEDLKVKIGFDIAKGLNIGLDAEKLRDEIIQLGKKEQGLAISIDNYKTKHEVKIPNLAELAHTILSHYEGHFRINIKEEADYKGLSRELSRIEDSIEDTERSCVVHYKDWIFDPRKPNRWSKHKIKEGDTVVCYHHNLNGESRELENLVGYIGNIVQEKDSGQIIDTHTICLKALHMVPASLIAAKNLEYEHAVFMEKIGGTYGEVLAKGWMEIMLLEAVLGNQVTIKYDPPKTKKDEKKLKEIREYNQNVCLGINVEEEARAKEKERKKKQARKK